MMVNKAHGHGGSSQNCGAHYVVQIIGVLVVITSNCEGFSTTRLSQPATASTSVRSRLQNINSPLPSARGSTWGLLFAGHGFLGENESGSEFRGASIAPWKTAAPGVESFTESFKVALERRRTLFRRMEREGTDCYRLYHGAVEGCPGLTVDRYSTVLLVQTFRDPPEDFGAGTVDELCVLASAAIADAVEAEPDALLSGVWNDRRKKGRRHGTQQQRQQHQQQPGEGIEKQYFGGDDGDSRGAGGHEGAEQWLRSGVTASDEAVPFSPPPPPPPHRLSSGHEPSPEALRVKVGIENGIRYPLAARHRGIDPWLFLDLRAARTWMLNNSKGLEVLNLFSYTGGVCAAAACGGAKSIWNVDFSATAHDVRIDDDNNGNKILADTI